MPVLDTDLTPTAYAGQPAICRARVSRAPADATDSVEVTLLNYSSTHKYEIPAGSWTPRGASLPIEGDLCAIGLDDDHDAWIIGWTGTNSPAVAPGDAAGGDLGGTYPNPSVVNINGRAVSAVVFTDDSRLTNARTPTAHAASHAAGGSDPLALGLFTKGTRAARPAANAVLANSLYYATDNGITYHSDGSSTWTAVSWQVIQQTGTGWLAGTGGAPAPEDQQQVGYVADATNGVIWRFRYRAASASTFKWEFVGGGWLGATQSASSSQSTAAVGTFTQMTNMPSITIPLPGEYRWEGKGAMQNPAAVVLDARVIAWKNGTTTLSGLAWFTSTGLNQSLIGDLNTVNIRAALVAGDTVSLAIATNNLTCSYGNPSTWHLALQPTRVG